MHRRWAAVAAVAVVLTGFAACGGNGDDETFTIAFLRALPSESDDTILGELRGAGFVPGENLEILDADPSVAHPAEDDARAAVEDWIERGVDLIFAFSSTGARVAAEVTSEVPILFLVNDPTAVGLLTNEQSPEGNLTGVTFRVAADRTLALAADAVPDLTHLGVLVPEGDPAGAPSRDAALAAAEDADIDVTVEVFRGDDDAERAVGVLEDAGAKAVLVVNAPAAVRSFAAVEAAATPAGLPLVANTDFAQGATVILTPDADELLAQLGRQAARILGGADPSDVPVENPRQFRVVLDAGKAAELGLPVFPQDLVRQADEVRE